MTTRIVHHQLDLNNMQSIVSHQPPPRFSSSSTSSETTTTTCSNFTRPNPNHRPPLLSIHQLQSTAISTTSHSPLQSPATSNSDYSTKLQNSITPTRDKRRKLRSTRIGSPVPDSLSLNPPSHFRPKINQPSRKPRTPHQTEPSSKDEDHTPPLLPLQRLHLKSSVPPLPPAIPQDLMITPSQCHYAHTPIIEPSYTTPRHTPHDTYTCIRTTSNPSSVSISSQPPVGFTKTAPKLTRPNRSNILSSHDSSSPSLERKKSEEQDKWWHWSKVCKVTGDGNKSSHLTPLRCRDLKRTFDDQNCEHSQDPSLRIQTRPFSESTLEQQKFYYSG